MTTEVEERNQRYYVLVKYSGMPIGTGQSCTLEQFLPGKGTQEAYNTALRYVSKHEHHFVTFVGEVGRGKTHLALGIGWQWIGQNYGVVKYWQVSELLDAMRKEYNNPPKNDYGIALPGEFEKAKDCSLLILDDLGVEKTTEWVADKLDTLINHRWLEGKFTVFTTNLAPGQLQPRIRSRIREGVTVTLEGPDYRELKAKLRKESNRE